MRKRRWSKDWAAFGVALIGVLFIGFTVYMAITHPGVRDGDPANVGGVVPNPATGGPAIRIAPGLAIDPSNGQLVPAP
jgi:hypothetical protein